MIVILIREVKNKLNVSQKKLNEKWNENTKLCLNKPIWELLVCI